jgi:hypothetical protein
LYVGCAVRKGCSSVRVRAARQVEADEELRVDAALGHDVGVVKLSRVEKKAALLWAYQSAFASSQGHSDESFVNFWRHISDLGIPIPHFHLTRRSHSDMQHIRFLHTRSGLAWLLSEADPLTGTPPEVAIVGDSVVKIFGLRAGHVFKGSVQRSVSHELRIFDVCHMSGFGHISWHWHWGLNTNNHLRALI